MDFIGPYPRSRSGNIEIFFILNFLNQPFTADVIIKCLEEELFHTFGVPVKYVKFLIMELSLEQKKFNQLLVFLNTF